MIRPPASTWTLEDLPLLSAFLPNFAPPVRLAASAWAEDHIVLPSDTNAEPGPLRLAPYQAQMIDLIDLSTTREAILMLASQTGKSIALDCVLLNRIRTNPGPMLHISPDESQAKIFVRQRLDPLVAASPKLKGMFGDGRRGGSGDSTTEKKFPGGFLAFGSAFKPTDLAGRAFRDAYFDEVDRFPKSSGGEGDPIKIGKKRLHTFNNKGNSKVIIASTPTLVPSPIAELFDTGSQHRFFMPCPECGNFDYLRFSHLKWKSGKPQTARLECEAEGCGHHITEAERRPALDNGEWRATAEARPGVLSFHATVLISYFANLEEVAQKYEDAQSNPHDMKIFRNTELAEVWVPEGTELEVDTIQARAEKIHEPYSAVIKDIVAAVDCQLDRLELTYLATAQFGEQAVLDHVVIEGNPNGPQVWADLDVALDRTFTLAGGRKLGVERVAIDSGWNPDPVYAFCKEHRRKRMCQPVKGSQGFDKPAVTYGLHKPGRPTVLHIGVDSIKEQIYKRLASEPDGPGSLHLPDHLDVGYFEQIAAERLVVKETKVGRKAAWQKVKSSARNEALDVLTYAIAIRTLIKDDARTFSAEDISDKVVQLHKRTNG